ncbi:MAG TPA: iron ABC transporter permease [Terriglobia bacterium]|nr:iron ABC transporter permease [Terriglobia bacterium]
MDSSPAGRCPRPATDFHTVRFRLGLLLLLLLLMLSIFFAAGMGAVRIPSREIACIIFNRIGFVHLAHTWPRSDETIILQVRLPRVLAAALVGAALSVAGVLFQGLLRNPLADPYVIGTSGGAAFGASLGTVLFTHFSLLGFGTVPTLAFLGALGTMLLVYRLSRVAGRTPVVTLLLAGFAVSVILGYSVSFLLIISQRAEFDLQFIYAWMLGGIWIERWSQLGIISLIVFAGAALAFTLARSLNAFALGEEFAAYLGIHVERQKMAVIGVGCLLTAAAVSAGGLIGFVGLIVPHFLRLLFGPDNVRLLPLAALGGAAFLVMADLLSRVVMPPNELPVGILTAFVGGPAFLLLLRRSKREYRF